MQRLVRRCRCLLTSGLNKPTVRRLLLALIRAGLVEQDLVTRRYYPGAEAYVLGIMAARRFSLVEICLESLRRLSRRSEDTSFVSLRRGLFRCVCTGRRGLSGAHPCAAGGQEHPLAWGPGRLRCWPDCRMRRWRRCWPRMPRSLPSAIRPCRRSGF
ncbi:helix-turn-helix domain-containing protein [Pannonibacter sp. Pt2-lr]